MQSDSSKTLMHESKPQGDVMAARMQSGYQVRGLANRLTRKVRPCWALLMTARTPRKGFCHSLSGPALQQLLGGLNTRCTCFDCATRFSRGLMLQKPGYQSQVGYRVAMLDPDITHRQLRGCSWLCAGHTNGVLDQGRTAWSNACMVCREPRP